MPDHVKQLQLCVMALRTQEALQQDTVTKGSLTKTHFLNHQCNKFGNYFIAKSDN